MRVFGSSREPSQPTSEPPKENRFVKNVKQFANEYVFEPGKTLIMQTVVMEATNAARGATAMREVAAFTPTGSGAQNIPLINTGRGGPSTAV